LLAGRTDISYSGARLSLTLTGRANRLTPCNKAKPGDEILVAVDLRGQGFGTPLRFWDCSQDRKAGDLWADIGILPFFSEEKFVRTSKSVGLSGIVGTIALLAEASGFGCQIDLDEMPCPPHVEMADWLCAFMSFGFVFTAHSRDVQKTIEVLGSRHIACESVGQIAIGGRVELELGDEVEVIFDLRDEPIRGWKP
jgi:selenophosphate synthetase-related protein